MEKLAAIDCMCWTRFMECLLSYLSRIAVTAEDIQAHMKQLLAESHTHALVVGTMTKEVRFPQTLCCISFQTEHRLYQAALSMVDIAEQTLASTPLPSDAGLEHSLILPEGRTVTQLGNPLLMRLIASNHVYRTSVPNPNEPNSSLSYYVHFGPTPDAHLRVRAALLAHILSEPAFNVLRTKEQLGYIVSASQWTLLGDGECGLRVVVQSERGPVYLERRVDAFLRGMERTLAEMPEEEFEEQKRGVQRRWQETAKNLKEEASRFWTQVESGYLDFYRREYGIYSQMVGRAHAASRRP